MRISPVPARVSPVPVRNSLVTRAAGSLAPVVLLAGLLAGCGTDDPKAGCDWMKDQAAASGAGGTVILVDGSASVRGTASDAGGLDYAPAIDALLRERVGAGDVFSVGTFAGAPGDVDWVFQKRSADWKRSARSSGNQESNRDDAIGCLAEDVSTARRTVPAGEGTDVLAALSTGTGLFHGVEGPRRLVVLSDGLSTVGCADLRQAAFGSEPEIKAIVSVCATRGEFAELPDLDGVGVTFVGLGRSAGNQPSANHAQRDWLARLWKTLCERAGGAGTTCTTSDAPVGSAPAPDATGPVPADPVVPYRNGRSRTYPLPGAALFDTDSARLRPAATAPLTGIAVRARTTPGLDRVEVDGYVDPRGGSGNDRSLSQSRADAVAELLVAHGVPESHVSAYGRGVSPGCSPGRSTEDMSDKERLQCDRRVDVRVFWK
ncbi:OmpA family protein [Streptomyces zaehneri]|uniref:OmpA family protein n=1 Tax=Streptomyces zaehneri TaxID=3051180 RepID=UPI0028D09A16|nr:OmpA family protein [Streptomyces sp. DSM 40713]